MCSLLPCTFTNLAILLVLAAPASAQNVLHTFVGDAPSTGFGCAVANAGDVDGDGRADVIVGIPYEDDNGLYSGMARVYSGANGSVLRTFLGTQTNDFFGFAVDGAGDVDGDGRDDVIVGAYSGWVSVVDAGLVRVHSGQTGAVLFAFEGDSTHDELGIAVAGAGDVNADGFVDLVAGADGDDDNGSKSGSARVFSGQDGTVLYTFHGDSAGDSLGLTVDGAGDVDGDGFDDLVAGAYEDDNTAANAGSARVFSGKDGAILYTFDGDSAFDGLGFAVAGAGDVNGDGHGDLLVGAPFDDNTFLSAGSARLLSGIDGSLLLAFDGTGMFSHFGAAVGPAGDADGDGFADVVAGGFFLGDLPSQSSARVFSGVDGSELYRVEDPTGVDAFGEAVAGGGDVDDDGHDDFIVAVRDLDFSPMGDFVRVYTGKPSVVSFGTGCGGLAALWQGEPVIGTADLKVHLAGAPPLAPCALLVGVSDVSWLGIPLPFDLAAAGAPGCMLYTSLDALVPATTSAIGEATVTFALPNVPAFVGLVGFLQWMAADPGANPLGFTFSGAIEITVQAS